MRSTLKQLTLVLALAFVSSKTAAQPTSDAPPTVAELAEEEARALFNAGLAAYEAGRFEDALWSFQRAYDRSGRALLLYNVGQCLDRLRRDQEAVDTFERYLAFAPEADNRHQVEARIFVIRQAIARQSAPPTALVPTAAEAAATREPTVATPRTVDLQPDAPSSHRGRRIGLIAGGGIVGVAVIVATVLLVRADRVSYSSSDVGTVFALRGGRH